MSDFNGGNRLRRINQNWADHAPARTTRRTWDMGQTTPRYSNPMDSMNAGINALRSRATADRLGTEGIVYDEYGREIPQEGQQQPGLGPRATTGQIMDYIADWYPGMIGFFDSNPEIRAKLTEAAKWGWTPGKLNAEVSGTSWYRQTAANARDFELMEAQDPASAKAIVAQTAANIQNSSATFGLGLSPQQVAGMAWNATRNGWTDAQTTDALLKNLNWATVQGGTLTATVDDIKSVAGDYLVQMSDGTAQKYAARIASGELTLTGVESILQKQARGRFSWMGDEIDQGVTPSDYFAPVADTIASTLEVAPDSINLMDPKWLSLVEVRDQDSGKMRAATLNEAMLSARRQTGFVNTQGAAEMTAGLTQLLRGAFGG